MCFLVAALALVTALVTSALIAPRSGNRHGLKFDPCMLETGDWRIIDPNCSKMQIRTAPIMVSCSKRMATVTRPQSVWPDGSIGQ